LRIKPRKIVVNVKARTEQRMN